MIFSAYGLPVFKFDSTTETLKRSETFVYIHYASLIGLVVYAQLTFLIFGQIHVAVIVLCFFEIAGFYSLGQMLTSNYHTIGEHKKELTSKLLIWSKINICRRKPRAKVQAIYDSKWRLFSNRYNRIPLTKSMITSYIYTTD
jgi:hypothetical protein